MRPIAIRVEALTKRFGDRTVVDKISFSVNEGELFAFLGPNGAGKTTTIKMLTTLLHPTSGAITLQGHDPLRHQDAARKAFGIVFQDSSLDSDLTAYENMDLHAILYGVPSAERRKRIEDLLRMVDLWDRKDDLVKTFSGGMRRRLEIARGLTHHPKILFLDEPTLGLDPQTRNKMWDYVQDLSEHHGMTVFFTTHYLEEAQKYARRIAIIDRGQIVAQGTAKALMARTKTKTLEEAFLSLTGSSIRDEPATVIDGMRAHRRVMDR